MGRYLAMDSRDLAIFRVVARSASISAAADKLGCAQSNVSARIHQLEDSLQVKLFYRRSRGVALTPAGRVLQGYAERIVHLMGEAEKAVRDSLDHSGPLAIGAMETTAAVRLPAILSRYHAVFPKVRLTLVTGHTADLLGGVLAHDLDGAFVGGPVDHPDIIQEETYVEELVLVTARDIEDLARSPRQDVLVFRKGCTYRIRTEQWARENSRLVSDILEFGSVEAILGCAAAGMGLTLLPRSVVERPPHNEHLRAHTIPPRLAHVPTYFIRHKDTAPTTPLLGLLEHARGVRPVAAQ